LQGIIKNRENKMQNLLTELHYFPCVAYFSALAKAETAYLEVCEHYTKQSYRNRCYVRGANQVERLTVPVVSNSGLKVPIKAVKIDYGQRWQAIHWRTIEAAYGKAPYFLYYADLIKSVLEKKQTYLFDLNEELLQVLLKIMQIKVNIVYTESYKTAYEGNFLDLRNSWKLYGEPNEKLQPYKQVFGTEFIANLSVLDLIFCKGNQARAVVYV
jgi:hypothetical protein